jgi:chromosome segregation ATPase
MTSKQEVNPHDEMLSGWKDIANYMGKGVRTVQRYERDLGLPVRSLSGHPTGAVIATKSDLDSWVRSSATAQESINRAQKALNVAPESRNVAQESRNIAQDSFNKEARRAADYLVSEIAKGLRGRTELQAQMTELRMSVSKVRENLLKLRQQVNEMRQRQDVMASVIKDYSKVRALLSASGMRQKPN